MNQHTTTERRQLCLQAIEIVRQAGIHIDESEATLTGPVSRLESVSYLVSGSRRDRRDRAVLLARGGTIYVCRAWSYWVRPEDEEAERQNNPTYNSKDRVAYKIYGTIPYHPYAGVMATRE